VTAERGITVEPLTPDGWNDLVALFGTPGAYANCWCTWWRQSGADFDAGCRNRGSGNRALLESLTAQRREPGLIGYRDGKPVGWVSVAPRAEYGRILRSPLLGPGRDPAATDPTTWAVVCFWMPRAERGKGVASTLLRAAIDHARAHGARTLEAYPIDADGVRRPSANLFTGTLSMFERAGFSEIERRRGNRPIVRLAL
jgi:GNAT superfamily N-acetyltransferase